jgi:hypothetical protein
MSVSRGVGLFSLLAGVTVGVVAAGGRFGVGAFAGLLGFCGELA